MLVSAVSLWEIVVKIRLGKLDADIVEIAAALPGEDFAVLGITTAHLVSLAALPAHHRDPFDHLLIAQAIAEDAVFVTDDGNAQLYPARILTCSDARA